MNVLGRDVNDRSISIVNHRKNIYFVEIDLLKFDERYLLPSFAAADQHLTYPAEEFFLLTPRIGSRRAEFLRKNFGAASPEK